ncbi:hypothetical protein KAFR_0J01250 [Kazachstania africana CBS 2517]|uniref:Stress response protein NST1 n=1 Tax=Kazachstania africana (strain ATCC 22294 / BCRC 22015 / CBS 2517 / CECT 1963 / NBRC 1671 / NRRL Y-8276) TaxID=1071382 RepID=H2B0P2_KAZAF|nr:hypothetical protein KAFR_0J01250 [Kazachstania africana CBS 2517]CCF60192.1 hypothetical protein KAFR_0J01250 [Kazachstania africana CBS 2517]
MVNKKRKSKANKKKSHIHQTSGQIIQADVLNDDEYPTSRIIKRAPNGDVIVEPLNHDIASTRKKKIEKKDKLSFTLDSHWESLTSEEKKQILIIDKDELFGIIKQNQMVENTCNCSVCGRKHISMDKEIERIYNMLFEIDRIKDPDLNPVKFHLSIIKELQINNNIAPTAILDDPEHEPPSELIDATVNNNILNGESLKEEVLNFKQQKHEEDGELREKYLQFTKNFVSSHPKIAEEYVKRVMMYPEMKSITNDLINNSNQSFNNSNNFLKAIENFVIERTNSNNGTLSNPEELTTMLHDGKQLTQEEYVDLQHTIAERMTNSYDTKRKEFKEISPVEKELFTRFMFGENRKEFGEFLMQSFRDKFDSEFGGSSVSASLAAAAAAASLTSPLTMNNNHIEEDEYEDDYDDDYAEYESDSLSEYADSEDYEDYEEDDHHHHHQFYQDDENSYEDEDRDDEDEEDEAEDEVDEDDINENDEVENGNFDENNEHDDEEYESEIDEAERLEEGRKLIQIAITKLLQSRIMDSYHARQADNNRLKLLKELEDEQLKKKEKKEKKLKKKEKEKEKKKQQQLAKEEAQRRKAEEEERLRQENEKRELERRELQRQKVEEAKRKKDEEKRRKLEEQRKREELQEKQRKIKEEQRRKKEEEKRLKEEQKRIKEENRLQLEMQRKAEQEQMERDTKEKELQEIETKQKQQAKPRILKRESVLSQHTGETSVPIPNLGYPTLKDTLPSLNTDSPFGKQSVNDDIFEMINAAAASKTLTPSPSHLNTLLQQTSEPPTLGQQIMNPSPTSLPPQSQNGLLNGISNGIFNSMLPSAATNNAFSKEATTNNDNINQVHFNSNLFGIDLQPQSQAHVPQSFSAIPTWNTLSTPPVSSSQSLLNANQDSLPPTSQQQNVPLMGSVNPSQQPQKAKSFVDELNSLSNMLSSAGLADTSYHNNNSQSLWNDSRLSATHETMSMPLSHRRSIWDNNPQGISSSMLSNTDTPNNPNYLSSSIWSNSNSFNSSFMNNNVVANNNNDGNFTADSDIIIFDNIYKVYLTLMPLNPTTSYVPMELLYRNLGYLNLDYTAFENKLMQMQKIKRCEVVTDMTSGIKHVRLSGPSHDIPKSSGSALTQPFNSNDGNLSFSSASLLTPSAITGSQ